MTGDQNTPRSHVSTFSFALLPARFALAFDPLELRVRTGLAWDEGAQLSVLHGAVLLPILVGIKSHKLLKYSGLHRSQRRLAGAQRWERCQFLSIDAKYLIRDSGRESSILVDVGGPGMGFVDLKTRSDRRQ